MSKDIFKASKARHTGGDTNEAVESLRNEFVQETNEIVYKNHTIRLSEPLLEKIKDFVYFKKINGFPFYSQSELIEHAVYIFLENLSEKPSPRPDELKIKEKKRTGRKSKKRPSIFNTSDFSL